MGKINFIELLNSIDKFIIPTIQRDYAQGRNEGNDKELCEEVRNNFVNNLYDALIENKELILDYVYGSEDNKIFYPIDGQQRLTTLFLLHWYLGKKENIDIQEILEKFTYEIRDTTKEFCHDLLEINIDFKNENSVSSQIKNSPKYHLSYDYDSSIASMLVMIDKIDELFRKQACLWDRLQNIKFWVLSLENFGLTDDLFVKMNARGKRLSRFDVFKSDLESMLSKHTEREELINIWKNNIDNDYLDAYWKKFISSEDHKLVEINLFRTITFYFKSLISIENKDKTISDDWELEISKLNYNDIVIYLNNNIDRLNDICHLFSIFDVWSELDGIKNLFVFQNGEQKIVFYKKVEIFGLLYWFSKANHNACDDDFYKFNRILLNYIYSIRQADYKPTRRYSSNIDNNTKNTGFIVNILAFVKKLIDEYNCNDVDSFVIDSAYDELSFEKEKLEAVKNKTVSLNELVELENLPYLKRNIHNIFFNNKVYLTANQLNKIFTNDDLINKSLRIILSYSKDEYGKFVNLLFDKISQQSGKKQLYYNGADDLATGYYHIYSFISESEFGDRILTAKGNNQYGEISRCVKMFVKELSSMLEANKTLEIDHAIDDLLRLKIEACDFNDKDNIKSYFVKYKEFWSQDRYTIISTLRRKNYGGKDVDNIYDIQCLTNENRFFDDIHYQPFYLALAHLLSSHCCGITIDENSLKYVGTQIEYAHPCILSNGWKINITSNGDWNIDFCNNIPNNSVIDLDINGTKGTVKCSNVDSIQKMYEILQNF